MRYSFAVKGGLTLEMCIAHYWSSLGQSELSFELVFHSLLPSPSVVHISPAMRIARVDVEAHLAVEELNPSASLTTLRRAIRPSSFVVRPLLPERDRIWDGRQVFEQVCTYNFTVPEGLSGSSVTPVRIFDLFVTSL